MFETYGFDGVHCSIQAVLTLYAQGLLTGTRPCTPPCCTPAARLLPPCTPLAPPLHRPCTALAPPLHPAALHPTAPAAPDGAPY